MNIKYKRFIILLLISLFIGGLIPTILFSCNFGYCRKYQDFNGYVYDNKIEKYICKYGPYTGTDCYELYVYASNNINNTLSTSSCYVIFDDIGQKNNYQNGKEVNWKRRIGSNQCYVKKNLNELFYLLITVFGFIFLLLCVLIYDYFYNTNYQPIDSTCNLENSGNLEMTTNNV